MHFPENTDLFKFNNRSTRKRLEICLKLTVKTQERRHLHSSGVFMVTWTYFTSFYSSLLLVEQVYVNWDCLGNLPEKNFMFSFFQCNFLNPFQDGGQKSPTSFYPVTSTNVKISSINLVLSLLPHWRKISRPYMSPIIEIEPRAPHKKNWFFWSNRYKTEVIITSLIEMLDLLKFGHMTTYTV